MKNKFDIEVPVPGWLKLVAVVALLPASLVLASKVVYADVPNNFKDGDTLSAQKLNDNFAALDQRLVTIESHPTVITKNGKSITSSATFCGTSAAPQTGKLGGYAGGKTLCENIAACNSPTAHMCSSEEVLRSVALGMTLPEGRFAAFDPLYECDGFTIDGTGAAGVAWNKTRPAVTNCSTLMPVLCCD